MFFLQRCVSSPTIGWGWIKKAKVLHEWTAAVCHCLSEARHHCCPAVPLLQGQPVPVLPDYGWKPTQAPRGHQGDLHVGPEGLPGEHQKTLGQGRRDGHETGARRVATQDRAFKIYVHSATVWLFFFHMHVFRHSSTEPSTVRWPNRPTWTTTPSLCTPWTDGHQPTTAWWSTTASETTRTPMKRWVQLGVEVKGASLKKCAGF